MDQLDHRQSVTESAQREADAEIATMSARVAVLSMQVTNLEKTTGQVLDGVSLLLRRTGVSP